MTLKAPRSSTLIVDSVRMGIRCSTAVRMVAYDPGGLSFESHRVPRFLLHFSHFQLFFIIL